MSKVKKNVKFATAACLFVGAWEGVQTHAYPDPATRGHPWTICYGETSGVKKGDKRTMEECKTGLVKELDVYADKVDACTKAETTDEQKIAFYSFSWNLGPGRYCSKIAPLVNTGQMKEACDKLLQFNTAAGIPMRGLTRRRQAERELCMKGVPT